MASSDYRAAIEATERTIQRRAVLYRNQIVVFVLYACAIFVVAALYSWRLLTGMAFLMPISGVFLALDVRRVRDWRLALLGPWTRREIDFTAFRQAITAHPKLPPGTLDGMLALLPTAPSLTKEQSVQPSTRSAVSALVTAAGQTAVDDVVIRVAATTIVAAVVAIAVAMHRWQPLGGLATLLLLPTIGRRRRAHVFRAADRAVEAERQQAGFDETDFAVLKDTV